MLGNIDLVYLWLDGNDPKWQAKRDSFMSVLEKNTLKNKPNDALCDGRYANNNELKYSLRSIEKHAPWIRKIFIVTDNQIPSWLDTSNSKIKIIDHSEIIPSDALPCFNSGTIEYFIHKIPDLSEHFIYANDDMFLNRNVLPGDFFNKDGKIIVRLLKKRFGAFRYKWENFWGAKHSFYKQRVLRASGLVADRCGKRYWGFPHHNIDAYLKSDYKNAVENIFKDIVDSACKDRIRNERGLQRVAILYYSLAIDNAVMRYATKNESYYSPLYEIEKLEYVLARHKPMLFCLNDDEHANNNNRILAKEFLSTYFPEKSEFEK